MIAVRIDVGEDHTHVNLLAWTEAHLELILSANIASSDAFLDRKLALQDFLVSRTLLKTL
jgi:hypothetical protein